jgi:FG-GAP-like repeat/FG-GAP repeat
MHSVHSSLALVGSKWAVSIIAAFVLSMFVFFGSIFAQDSFMVAFSATSAGGSVINRGDFNNDGIPDIVVGNNQGTGSGTYGLSVSLGKGDGRFQPVKNSAPGLGVTDIAIGDFNGDGKLDVALLAYNNTPANVVQIMLGNGDGTFSLGQTITNVPGHSITTGDFNNDGKLDLAVGTKEVDIYKGAGNGTFSKAASISVGNPYVWEVRVGDFNGDGKTDIVTSSGAENNLNGTDLAVLWNAGNFTFSLQNVASAPYAISATPVDVNQDGYSDLLVTYLTCNGHQSSSPCVNWEVMLGSPQKDFTISANTHLDSSYKYFRGTTAADINGDGLNDIVGLTDSEFPNEVAVWVGNADGTYQSTPLTYSAGTDSSAPDLVASDFNRDGKIDFAIPTPGNSNPGIGVLLNATPRATCTPNQESPTVTVCQPQDLTYLNSPVTWIADSRDTAHPVTDMQIYVDNKLVVNSPSSTLNESLTLPDGPHFVVTKGWDASGANFVSDRNITIYSGTQGETCPVEPSSMNICLPTQGETTSTSLHVFANCDSASAQISSLQVYIDNNLIYNDQSGSTYVDTAFTVTQGSHYIVVKAFDQNGNIFSESRNITAK